MCYTDEFPLQMTYDQISKQYTVQIGTFLF